MFPFSWLRSERILSNQYVKPALIYYPLSAGVSHWLTKMNELNRNYISGFISAGRKIKFDSINKHQIGFHLACVTQHGWPLRVAIGKQIYRKTNSFSRKYRHLPQTYSPNFWFNFNSISFPFIIVKQIDDMFMMSKV